ncbi:MAG TPA: ABC transporter substrate-binding protein [Lachnospiraceae bacterium]|nr:ABC transporter substrate-binding protein [Lachnospiraceae bacterium]
MKKMQKFISLALAVVMTAGLLAGCGSTSAGTSAATTSGASASGSTFKIGGIGPLTGTAAVYGTAVKNAAQIAVDEVNAAGGINGSQVELKFEDDELDAEKSVNAYNTLKDWGMQMLVGSVTSACSIAVSEKTKADSMFQITPSGSAADCVKYDNVFRVCFSDPNQGVASADYIADNKVATKVAVIYDSSDVYSSGIYQKFDAEAKTKNLSIVSAEAFTGDSKTDFSAQLQKAKDAGADLVFLPIYYTEASIILTQANSMGYAPKFFGCDGLDGILAMKNFDTKLAEGVMLLTPFAADATDELTQKFVAAYKKAYTDTPNQFAADAYDAIYAIKAAAEAGKVTPSMKTSEMCTAMEKAMTTITLTGLTGTITWTADGEPSKTPKAVEIKDGAYVSMK